MQVREQRAALEQLGLDLAVRRLFELGEKVADRDVARMRRRGIERAPQQ